MECPPSWVIEICQRETDIELANCRAAPVISNDGLPDRSVCTITSCQVNPAGPPRDLATASFAANLAASEAELRIEPSR